MKSYFNIANINICIESEIKIQWNVYIQKFRIKETGKVDEYYEVVLADDFKAEGILVYQDKFQKIYKKGDFEERLHYFYGDINACMLYRECQNRKLIFLKKKYERFFREGDNYAVFNALAFEKLLLKHRGIILHASFIIWQNRAILFSAPSGTGKSTQAELWKNFQGAVIANGDRVVIKKENGIYYAYGLPICGSSNVCLNIKVPLATIIYITQSQENFVKETARNQAFKYLISETTINYFDTAFASQAVCILEDIGKNIDMYHLFCKADKNATVILKKKLEENRNGSDSSFESH